MATCDSADITLARHAPPWGLASSASRSKGGKRHVKVDHHGKVVAGVIKHSAVPPDPGAATGRARVGTSPASPGRQAGGEPGGEEGVVDAQQRLGDPAGRAWEVGAVRGEQLLHPLVGSERDRRLVSGGACRLSCYLCRQPGRFLPHITTGGLVTVGSRAGG